jgi:hypothetical protein
MSGAENGGKMVGKGESLARRRSFLPKGKSVKDVDHKYV